MKKVIILLFSIFIISGCAKEYYCDSGDTLKETTCISKSKMPATPHYTCPLPYEYLNGSRCCSRYTGYCYDLPRISSYSCDIGYLSGSECIIEITYNAYEK